MYTIIMNENKDLITTSRHTLYQREKLIEKIQFLLPTTYNDLDLTKFQVVLKYADQLNVPHAEILTRDEELYKNRIRCTLPVDTNLSKFSGDIKIRLTLDHVDLETNNHYVLNSGENVIKITPLEDFYHFVPDESLEFVDQIVGALEVKMTAMDIMASDYSQKKADNIVLNKETSEIYLTSNGVKSSDVISVNDLGNVLAEDTEDGLVQVVL